MKRIIFTALLLISMQAVFAQHQIDSLQGKWEVKQMTSNTKNYFKSGTLYFSDDGKFVSAGNHFGSMQALYTTNETTSTVFIESGNNKTEWAFAVKNGMLYLTSIDNEKGKSPTIKIIARKLN